MEQGEHERDADPQQAEPTGERQPFEDRVQPPGAVPDDPALELSV
jgi:hypothetical protein